jgi:hypothetical protein
MILDWSGSSQGLVAVRDFGLAHDRLGSSASFQAQVAHFRLYSETRHGRPRRKATDEAWRIATNIAKLPELLIKRRPDLVDRVPRR